jgi:hypothetical protein
MSEVKPLVWQHLADTPGHQQITALAESSNARAARALSNDKLDRHQLASFDLAWCAAEVTGARLAIELRR